MNHTLYFRQKKELRFFIHLFIIPHIPHRQKTRIMYQTMLYNIFPIYDRKQIPSNDKLSSDGIVISIKSIRQSETCIFLST